MPIQKTLIVYYSLEGNTKFIAETLAKNFDADLLELKPEKEISSKNFMKFFWGGKQVMMKENPGLLPLDKDPNDYDLIIIGTPVWAFNYAPPLRTFFSNHKILNKKVALFCTHEGNPGKTLTNMANEQFSNQLDGQIEFLNPLKNKEETLKKIENWSKQIIS